MKIFALVLIALALNVQAQDSIVVEYKDSGLGCYEVIKVYRKNGSLKKVSRDNWNGQRSVNYYFLGMKFTRKRFWRSHVRSSVPPCYNLGSDTIIFPIHEE